MVTEIQIVDFLQGDEVYVRMGHIKAYHRNAHLLARNYFLDSKGDASGEHRQFGVSLAVQVENVVHFLLGNAQHMTFLYGVDVKKSKAVVSFCHFIARNLACYDF